MEASPALEVYDLAHLGLVAGIMDRVGLAEVVDRKVGARPGEKVSTGTALKAAVLNALGFVASPLYLFGHFFQGKPTEHLLGPGVTPERLNDDRMGRMLDTLYEAGVTGVFLEIAKAAREAFPFPVRALHVDATSFHVHGAYECGGPVGVRPGGVGVAAGAWEDGGVGAGPEEVGARFGHVVGRDPQGGHAPEMVVALEWRPAREVEGLGG